MEVLEVTTAIRHARSKWHYRGEARPPFAEATHPGEESVWDFPRPPRTEAVTERLCVVYGDVALAATNHGVRVLETAGAPTYYFPPADVESELLLDVAGQSLCEWKGLATSFGLRDQIPGSPAVGWRYDLTFSEFEFIKGWLAFYPSVLACYIAEERVRAQPGGYYGGWVSQRLKGPIKGEPGSEAW